jgi:hypothetical protein
MVPYGLRPHNLWYKFSCFAWKRYTTTKPRTLGHEWTDRDALLIHTVFEIVRKFLEKEGPKTEEEWTWQSIHNPGFYASWKESKDIIDWWINDYKSDYVWDLTDEQFDKEYPWVMPSTDEYSGTFEERRSYERFLAEDKYEAQVREKAKRLIDISPYYWT